MRRHILACTAVLLVTLLGVAPARALTTPALLDSLQQTSFKYFWNEVNPANGLIRDRSTSGSPASIAATGFGLSAICIGVDHGWVTREAARQRVLTTLNTFWTKPQGTGQTGYIGYKGLYYHFLDMTTATRTWTSEVSTIDSALLFAGMLDARQYFSGADSVETRIRALADSIYYRADWNFFRNLNPGILMGWKAGTGFAGFGQWIGYNEATILYLLALGSPTHPVPTTAWTAWTSGYDWWVIYGYSFVSFPPLFGHQYSHCWIDFRGIQDAYMSSHAMDYFENSRRATLAQRNYCIANPGGWVGYGANLWGLTASDYPGGYQAAGAPPAQNDNGTIAPTAPAGSIPFAPTECVAVLQNLYDTYHAQLWGRYGFKDAFNLTQNWWDTDYIGIDQGPVIIMIENYLNGRTWNRIRQDQHLQTGLLRAGFSAPSDAPVETPRTLSALHPNTPNPFHQSTVIRYDLASPGRVLLTLTDAGGRRVATLVDEDGEAGPHAVTLEARDLPSGVYFYNLAHDGKMERRRCVLVR
jgi:hypothetical protein